MLDRSTPSLLLLLLFRLISHGELFCLFHVDENCLKLYPWTIVHTNSPCKHILVNVLFDHCLLVEGSQSLYIVSLIVLFVLLGIDYFGLQELFEGWCCLYLHKKSNTCFQYVLKQKMDITTTQDILLFRLMLCAIVLFFGETGTIALFIDSFFSVSNICSDYSRTSSV